MIVLDCEQGAPEWFDARIGVVTASAIEKIITPAKLQPAAAATTYLHELAAEWFLGEPLDAAGGSFWTDRGQRLEPQARAYFSTVTGQDVREVGFVYRDESREVGASPDGIVGPRPLELKCPAPQTHIGYWDAGVVPKAYRIQVQAQIWVMDAPGAWFMSYCPGLPPLLVEVERDEKVQAALHEHVPAFLVRLRDLKDALRAEGVEGKVRAG